MVFRVNLDKNINKLNTTTEIKIPVGDINDGIQQRGSLLYNRGDNQVYYSNGVVWLSVGGGEETLAETLALGNVTGGTDIQVSDGDVIAFERGGNTISLEADTPAANRVVTFSDPGADAEVAYLAATQSFTNKTITDTGSNVTASGLFSATTTVSVSTATAPTADQVLTAINGTSAEWRDAAGAGTLAETLALGNTSGTNAITTGNDIGLSIGDDLITFVAGPDSTNVRIGILALNSGTGVTGTNNIAIGDSALSSLTTESSHIGIGRNAGNSATGNSDFMVIGNNSGSNLENNSRILLIGNNICPNFAELSSDILVIGDNAMNSFNGTGSRFIAIGTNALTSFQPNDEQGDQVAIGHYAMESGGLSIGGPNVAIGNYAMNANTGGSQNVVIGHQAFENPTSGNFNVCIGQQAMQDSNGANHNIAIGIMALQNVTSNSNLAIGSDSLIALTTGTRNFSIGNDSTTNLTTGSDNLVLGNESGLALGTTSNNNTVIGVKALGSGTPSVMTNNTSIGFNSLRLNVGDDNTAIGQAAGAGITTGNDNVIIGSFADVDTGTFSNCVVLGRSATALASGEFVLGSTTAPLNTQATVGAAGGASALPASPSVYLQIRINGTLYVVPAFAQA